MSNQESADRTSHVDQAGQNSPARDVALTDDQDRRSGAKPTGQAGTGQTEANPSENEE